jgi:membrane protein implicated in regulation of membrane protease activity
MRLDVLFLLAVSIAVASVAADSASLSGKWQIQRSATGRESQQECTFNHKGNDLAGSCSTARGTVEMSGKVDGKNVTWTYKSDSEGGPVTVVYKGSLESATKITGTVSAIEFGISGEFTATRSN